MKTQYPMIPFPLIVKATDGDTEAINQITRFSIPVFNSVGTIKCIEVVYYA